MRRATVLFCNEGDFRFSSISNSEPETILSETLSRLECVFVVVQNESCFSPLVYTNYSLNAQDVFLIVGGHKQLMHIPVMAVLTICNIIFL